MGALNPDGSILSSKMPRAPQQAAQHYQMYGLYRGTIKDIIYPDDLQGDTMQYAVRYVVQVRGQLYYNAVDMRRLGGIFDHSLTVHKPTEFSGDGQAPGDGTFDQLVDGGAVFVQFVEGNADMPVIMGSAPHPRGGTYLPGMSQGGRPTRSNGRRMVDEYNGIEISVDDQGTYEVKIVGKKGNDRGLILNPTAVGASIKLDGETGDVTIQDARGNKVEMTTGAVNVTVHGNLSATADGDVSVTTTTGDVSVTTTAGDTDVKGVNVSVEATGAAHVKGLTAVVEAAAGITLKSALNVVPGGVVCVNPVNNDPITGIPLVAVGGVTAGT